MVGDGGWFAAPVAWRVVGEQGLAVPLMLCVVAALVAVASACFASAVAVGGAGWAVAVGGEGAAGGAWVWRSAGHQQTSAAAHSFQVSSDDT